MGKVQDRIFSGSQVAYGTYCIYLVTLQTAIACCANHNPSFYPWYPRQGVIRGSDRVFSWQSQLNGSNTLHSDHVSEI